MVNLKLEMVTEDVDFISAELLETCEEGEVSYIVQAHTTGEVLVWCAAGPEGELLEVDEEDAVPYIAKALFPN